MPTYDVTCPILDMAMYGISARVRASRIAALPSPFKRSHDTNISLDVIARGLRERRGAPSHVDWLGMARSLGCGLSRSENGVGREKGEGGEGRRERRPVRRPDLESGDSEVSGSLRGALF